MAEAFKQTEGLDDQMEGVLEWFNHIEARYQDLTNEDLEGQRGEHLDRLRLSSKLLANICLNWCKIEESELNLRISQFEALQRLLDYLKNAGCGDRMGYFSQPTGSGKTVLMGLFAKLMDVKTLILVPTTNLLNQTRSELVNRLDYSESEIGIVGGRVFNPGNKMTICTYQSLQSLIGKGEDDFELVMCDEVHSRALGDVTRKVIGSLDGDFDEDTAPFDHTKIEEYFAKAALKLGFTATPNLQAKNVDDHYDLVSHVQFSDLVKVGILRQFKLIRTEGEIIPDDIDHGQILEEREVEILEREDIYRKFLGEFKELQEQVDENLNTAVFCVNIRECQNFKALAAQFGFKAAIVASRESDLELRAAEFALLSDEIDFILTVNKLAEGWDFPPLNCVMLARATMSPVKIIQPIGRAARKINKAGEEYAYVIETDWKIGMNPYQRCSETDGNGKQYEESESAKQYLGKKRPLTSVDAFRQLGETDMKGVFWQ